MSPKKIVAIVIFVLVVATVGYLARLRALAELSTDCRNNFRIIGLAMHNYEDQYGTLPPRVTRDANGVVLHSWRTLLLPYIGERQLYAKIDLSKPWNDPANATVMAQPISVYRCPAARGSDLECHYVAIEGANSVFDERKGISFQEILDDRSRTLAVVETRKAISHWGEPVDLQEAQITLDVNLPDAPISSHHAGGAWSVCSDGSAIFLPTGWKAQDVRDAATRSGYELAIMPDQREISADDQLLQKFFKEGGPSRLLDIPEPKEPELTPKALEFLAEIQDMDWIQLHERSDYPFPKDMRALAERLFEETGHGRFFIASTNQFIKEREAAKYWLQEAAIEEGFTMAEAKLVPTLLSFRDKPDEAEKEEREQLERLTRAVVRYWNKAERTKPRLHLPRNHSSTDAIPLVVCLHPDRLSPAFWENSFCDFMAEQLQVAVLVPSATVHYGPERYHWANDFSDHFELDHEHIETSLASVASQFQEKAGERVLIGFHQSAYLVLNITGQHAEKYAGGALIHPAMLDANSERSQAFIDDAKRESIAEQKLYVLYEPDQYREKFATFISKTLAPTKRHVELKLDEEASFVYPRQITTDSDLAPKVLEAIRSTLPKPGNSRTGN